MAKSTQKKNAIDMFRDIKQVKTKPTNTKEAKIAEAPVTELVSEDIIISNTISNIEDSPAPVVTKAPVSSFEINTDFNLNDITVKKERSKHGRCFYIDDDVFERLNEVSKARKTSSSDLLNMILKKALF